MSSNNIPIFGFISSEHSGLNKKPYRKAKPSQSVSPDIPTLLLKLKIQEQRTNCELLIAL
jgi:hypothetical protein